MRKLLLAVLLVWASVSFVGCGSGKPKVDLLLAPPPGARLPTDDEKVAWLKSDAHKRGLAWRVLCIKDDKLSDTQKDFLAVAWHKTEPEDQWHDRWIEEGDTQADAAYALDIALQGAPTHPAEQPKPHKPKLYCPPELRGD